MIPPAKILVQIDTFIKGSASVQVTEECIKRAKSLGYPILLTSHTEIPDFLVDMVDYAEIDLNNILLPDNGARSVLRNYTPHAETKIILKNPDPHAPACLTSIINGAKISLRLGFDYFIRLEYDTIFREDFLPFVQSLIQIGSKTSGCVFTNFSDWVDGKFLMIRPELYLECFHREINKPEDYFSFLSFEGVPDESWRHLQNVQYKVLHSKGCLSDMIQIPARMIENILDRDFLGQNNTNPGLFRPARILNSEDSFATITHGFENHIHFLYKIYENNSLVLESDQSFIPSGCTWKTFPFKKGTIYKIEYTNPVREITESWEFKDLEDLDQIAIIEFK